MPLKPPPAGRKDPFGVGMEEPPQADERGQDHEADGLVAAVGKALGCAPLLFGKLLGVRLDARFDHGGYALKPI